MLRKFVVGALTALAAVSSAQSAGFVNGGFDDGTLNGWTTGGGCRTTKFNNQLVASDFLSGGSLYGAGTGSPHFCSGTGNGAITSHSQIINAGAVDPNVGALIGDLTYGGTAHSLRVEDTTFGGYASVATQTVNNYTDPDIFFAWKAVLLGAHGLNDAATFIITLRDLTTNTELIRREYNAAAFPGAPFANSGGNFYTPAWQIEQLNIGTGLSGHNFQLLVLAADCEPTGHWGYVYLDGFGSVAPPPGVPEPGSLALAGVALLGLAAARRRQKA